MMKACGPFAKEFATAGDFATRYFTVDGSFKWKNPAAGESQDAEEVIMSMDKFPTPPSPVFLRPLEEHLKDPPTGGDPARHLARLRRLADLVGRCVVPDPSGRATPDQCLENKFFLNLNLGLDHTN